MNNHQHLQDFHIGQCVVFLKPNGEDDIKEGVVMGKDTRYISVLFDDELQPKNITPDRLRIL